MALKCNTYIYVSQAECLLTSCKQHCSTSRTNYVLFTSVGSSSAQVSPTMPSRKLLGQVFLASKLTEHIYTHTHTVKMLSSSLDCLRALYSATITLRGVSGSTLQTTERDNLMWSIISYLAENPSLLTILILKPIHNRSSLQDRDRTKYNTYHHGCMRRKKVTLLQKCAHCVLIALTGKIS